MDYMGKIMGNIMKFLPIEKDVDEDGKIGDIIMLEP
jgi:hypothetical protein